MAGAREWDTTSGCSGVSEVAYSRSTHWDWIWGAKYFGMLISVEGKEEKKKWTEVKQMQALKGPWPTAGKLGRGTWPSPDYPSAGTRILSSFRNGNITLKEGLPDVTCGILVGGASVNCVVTGFFVFSTVFWWTHPEQPPLWPAHVGMPCERATKAEKGLPLPQNTCQQRAAKTSCTLWIKLFASHEAHIDFL